MEAGAFVVFGEKLVMEEYACPFRDRDIVRLSKARIFIVLSGGECELDGLSNLCIPISTKYHHLRVNLL